MEKNINDALSTLQLWLEKAEDSYALVQFPEVQKYQEEDWFDDEAELCINIDGAYFIPLKYTL